MASPSKASLSLGDTLAAGGEVLIVGLFFILLLPFTPFLLLTWLIGAARIKLFGLPNYGPAKPGGPYGND